MTKVYKWSKWVGIVGLERFAWKIWGLIVLCLFVIIEGEEIWKVIKARGGFAVDISAHKSVTARISGAMFYTAALLGLIQCWRFSCSWKEISKYWTSVESILNNKYIPTDTTLKKRMYRTIVFVALCTIYITGNKFPSTKKPMCKMHLCLRQAMRLCRWAGVFPVEGLDKKTISKLRFSMKSAYAIYNCITLLGQIGMASLSAYYFYTNNLSLNNLVNFMFCTINLTSALLLLKLSRHWPELMKRANDIENRVPHLRVIHSSATFTRIAYTVVILSFLEYISSVIFKTILTMNCSQNFTINFDLMKEYFVSHISFVFQAISYSHWKGVIYEVMNIQSIFLWNFTDVMTMCVSLYLSSYFKNLNNLIENWESQKTRWEHIRMCYSNLVELVQIIDSRMCYLIFISSFTNVFFICVQLYSLLNRNYPEYEDCLQENIRLSYKSTEYYIYYLYSLLFLFVRVTTTSMLAANVNTVAQKPFFILHQVPPSEYTIEVQRFIRQTTYTTTALSGFMFHITRKTILAVIASIIKYELVLLQFTINTEKD